MKVYLVEDIGNSPGRIYAVMANKEDAEKFTNMLIKPCTITERTLFYSQPPIQGYNE